jgi:hypothetical protein
MAKLEKNIKRGKQISNEFENIIYNELINIYSQFLNFKNLHYLDFESIQDVFLNNPRYINTQLNSSDIYHKIIKYVNFNFNIIHRLMKRL